MNSFNSQGKLLDLIYSAPGDQQRWLEMLTVLAQELNATGAHIIQLDPSQRHQLEATVGLPEEAKRLYESHYGALDPWAIAGKQKFYEGSVWSGEEFVSSQTLLRSEFYNDFLHRYPIFHEVGACLLKQGPSVAVLTVHRARNHSAFDEETLRSLRLVLPHLQRALRLHHRMMDLKEANHALSEAFDSVPMGMVLLGPLGVLAANRAAREICALAKCLQLSSKGLRAAPGDLDRALQGLIASAMNPAMGNNGSGTILIPRESGEPLVLVTTPIRTGNWLRGTRAAVFITDPKLQPGSASQILRTAFGLTPAEARIASMLSTGSSVAQVAEELGVSLNTVRTQLKSVFAKTNTCRQSQLMALLAKLPLKR